MTEAERLRAESVGKRQSEATADCIIRFNNVLGAKIENIRCRWAHPKTIAGPAYT